jgi:hypothetical protein
MRQPMSSEPKSFEDRLRRLERFLEPMIDNLADRMASEIKSRAGDMALFDAVLSIAMEVGLDGSEVVAMIKRRRDYYHDFFLRSCEKLDPALGAMMDRRDPEDVSTISDAEGFPGGPPPDIMDMQGDVPPPK